MTDFATLREQMVEQQIAARGIDDGALLAAFRTVPREKFVAAAYQTSAYSDGPLPIGSGQTISQPYIVALMIAAADVRREDMVLEVGAGSGYAAAILGKVAREVIAIERHPILARHRQRDDRRRGRNPRLANGRAFRCHTGRGGGGTRAATTARPASESRRAARHSGWRAGVWPVPRQDRPQGHGGI